MFLKTRGTSSGNKKNGIIQGLYRVLGLDSPKLGLSFWDANNQDYSLVLGNYQFEAIRPRRILRIFDFLLQFVLVVLMLVVMIGLDYCHFVFKLLFHTVLLPLLS